MVTAASTPVVAIVGRPNVGKSTLFNALTRTRDALVADWSGLTRDRQYGRMELPDQEIALIDTGGMYGDEGDLSDLMNQQIEQALDEAHIILFVVSARDGVLADDETIMRRIRSLSKPVILLVNKAEGMDAQMASADFYQFGLNSILSISSSHRSGLSELKQQLSKEISELDPSLFPQVEAHGPRVTIIGRPNVGKSTLVNRLLREDRVLAFDMPGTTRDSISLPLTWDDRPYTLVDTAGVRKKGKVNHTVEKFSVIKTLQSIDLADVCVLLVDAQEGITEQDVSLLGLIVSQAKPVIIAINKWDHLELEDKEAIKHELSRRLTAFTWVPRITISALHGSGLRPMMNHVDDVLERATKVLQTNQLTNVLKDAIEAHQPPLVQGRSSQLKYAHSGGSQPTRIIIHGNRTSKLPDSYKKYLENRFRESFKLIGVPLILQFIDGKNPFESRAGASKKPANKSKKERQGISGRGKR
ncbi:ribosome biogenesis GTPase Der [Marinicella sp. W31]|uniref:ribosome biogenesis GTPase Der n=1 Tax=Marinicella sp. W31 TaxID=3023713 RepID=UPI0037562DC5